MSNFVYNNFCPFSIVSLSLREFFILLSFFFFCETLILSNKKSRGQEVEVAFRLGPQISTNYK